MLATIRSCTLLGINPLTVHVEVDVSSGLPCFEIVGLPGAAVREARDRVRTALKNSGYTFPLGRVTVNLAPAHVPKSGTLFDLPIAVGILLASRQIPSSASISHLTVVGELSLDGSLRSVRGALCIAAALQRCEETLVVPQGNLGEVNAVPGVRVIGATHLKELVERLQAKAEPEISPGFTPRCDETADGESWLEVRGQKVAQRALEIAVAGGHHILLVGPPGAGKTMLARRMVELVPPLTPTEVIEVSRVYSVAGLLSENHPFVVRRPFRDPHHSVTPAGLLGGGRIPRPGEVSLAHKGVLFLDEFPEFDQVALEGLRQPLEDGVVVVSRALGTCRFPAAFSLVAAANPCPCGFQGDLRRPCTCRPDELNRYRRRLSGPLMDRIDLFVHVERPDVDLLFTAEDPEVERSVALVRRRIERAHTAQSERFGGRPRKNGAMAPRELAVHASLGRDGEMLLRRAGKAWWLSPRAIHRVLKVARTIADLDGRGEITDDDLAEALSYRREGLFP